MGYECYFSRENALEKLFSSLHLHNGSLAAMHMDSWHQNNDRSNILKNKKSSLYIGGILPFWIGTWMGKQILVKSSSIDLLVVW